MEPLNPVVEGGEPGPAQQQPPAHNDHALCELAMLSELGNQQAPEGVHVTSSSDAETETRRPRYVSYGVSACAATAVRAQ